jgi:hypothetical protein
MKPPLFAARRAHRSARYRVTRQRSADVHSHGVAFAFRFKNRRYRRHPSRHGFRARDVFLRVP